MTNPKANAQSNLQLAQTVLRIEIDAIDTVASQLDERFNDAIALLLELSGRIIVMGMGKSGHIARKLAATLASTGSPAFFVHPAEAMHGDLGMISGNDVVIALSNSGESTELNAILPLIKRRGTTLIALTGRQQSTLGHYADVWLNTAVAQEACPLNLAPTASTTATLALGDALAVVLLQAKQFSAADFAAAHPGGALGRRLLTRIEDIMRPRDDLATVGPEASILDTIITMTAGGLGMTAVIDVDDTLLGVFTDGDFRRLYHPDQSTPDLRQIKIGALMSPSPITIRHNRLASEAARIMEQHSVNRLFVVNNDHQLLGAINFQDLLTAGVL